MRNGVLIGEDSPDSIILKQRASTLEEAFLSLSHVQEDVKVRDELIRLNTIRVSFIILCIYLQTSI